MRYCISNTKLGDGGDDDDDDGVQSRHFSDGWWKKLGLSTHESTSNVRNIFYNNKLNATNAAFEVLNDGCLTRYIEIDRSSRSCDRSRTMANFNSHKRNVVSARCSKVLPWFDFKSALWNHRASIRGRYMEYHALGPRRETLLSLPMPQRSIATRQAEYKTHATHMFHQWP